MNKLRFFITSGGTVEKIDSVRSIRNSSSGKLGANIANSIYSKYGEKAEIIYLSTKEAIKPNVPFKWVETYSVIDVEEKVREILTTLKVDVFIHAMAIADYTVSHVAVPEDLNIHLDTSKKLSSNIDNLAVVLKKAPKVISIIKKLQPTTFLVGFKLLDKVSEDELFDVGFNLLRKNRCNLVIANDISKIREGNHTALIIYPEKNYDKVISKEAIADYLVNSIEKRAFVKHPKSFLISKNYEVTTTHILSRMINIGEKLFEEGLLPEVINHNRPDKIGTYGNMSIKVYDDKSNSFLITGRNVHKGKLKIEDICFIENVEEISDNPSIYAKVNYYGKIKPSIDSAIHNAIYKNSEHKAIIHIHTDKVFLGIPTVHYNYPCGSEEEKNAILKLIEENPKTNIIQLYKHGLIILGSGIAHCYAILDELFDNSIPYIDYKGIVKDKAFSEHVEEVGGNFVYERGHIYPIVLNDIEIGTLWEDIDMNGSKNFAIYTYRNIKGLNIVKNYLALNKKVDYYLWTTLKCNIKDFYVNKYNFKEFEVSDRLIKLILKNK